MAADEVSYLCLCSGCLLLKFELLISSQVLSFFCEAATCLTGCQTFMHAEKNKILQICGSLLVRLPPSPSHKVHACKITPLFMSLSLSRVGAVTGARR